MPGASFLAHPLPRLTTPMTVARGVSLPIHFQSGPPESPVQASFQRIFFSLVVK
jgi:hypothetical protein